HAYTMQTTRHLVGVLVELSACMKLRHDDFGSRDAFPRMNRYGNTATIIHDGAGTIRVQTNIHCVAMAGQRLVDGVVHHLIDHVMKTGAVIRVADIHARPLAHGIKALQNLDGIGAIFFRRFVRRGHVYLPLNMSAEVPDGSGSSTLPIRSLWRCG